METREKFGSRLGFILISAGCAIGLGNVWRFPFIVGQYGGASFVLIYLFFLLILGLPIMAMEFSVGRASQKSVAKSFQVLEPSGSKWHIFSYFAMAGNYLLMMFYTTVAGWMVAYLFGMARGDFKGLDAEGTGAYFDTLLASPARMVFWMCLVVAGCFFICSIGLQKGVEKVTKTMMLCLLLVMIGLVIRCVTLPGAGDGLSFYLMPSLDTLYENGIWNSIYAAMGQAFFTLSIGMGSMAIFGSYINKDRTLFGEAVSITALDTFVAVMAGMIIFPACFAFGVNPGAGPGLIFVTLPNVFNSMPASQVWGTLFFVFMGFAAFSTVIAVFENIISFGMDLWGWSRKKTAYLNIIFIVLLSLPCVLGFNLLSDVNPLGGDSTILDLEDFIVSNNILPLGSLIYLAFCVSKYGWGWDKFIQEADNGKGLKFPKFLRGYVTWILPLIVLFIFVMGYAEKFFIS